MSNGGVLNEKMDKWPWIALIIFIALLALLAIAISGYESRKVIERHANSSGVKDIHHNTFENRTYIQMNDDAIIVIPGIHSVSDLCNDGIFEYKRYKNKYVGFLPDSDTYEINCIKGIPEIQ